MFEPCKITEYNCIPNKQFTSRYNISIFMATTVSSYNSRIPYIIIEAQKQYCCQSSQNSPLDNDDR